MSDQVSDSVNLHDLAVDREDTLPEGYRRRMARFGPAIGAAQLGGTIYELDQGDSICPYHYEGIEEEWLLVLTGTPTLRDPEGEHELVAGDLVCFVPGPAGAHKVTNRGATVARMLMLSTQPVSSVAVYPDSEKVGVWPWPGKRLRIDEGLDYWDGEL